MISLIDDCATSIDKVASIPAHVAMVGGGINGVCIASDAVARGRRTVLVERDDVGLGTSNRLSKLIHGGLRYLEHHEPRLVREALGERQLLATALAPHLGATLVNRCGVVECTRANGRVTGVVAPLRDALDWDPKQRSVTIDEYLGSAQTGHRVPRTVERPKVKA